MEATVTEYDYSVRHGKHIVQFVYNGTGLDPKYRPSRPVSDQGPNRMQSFAGNPSAFIDLPVALKTWVHKL